ncbi:MAG: hypothetical protein EP344_13330 [Bacteroidetes bacterium]|nr:MAG: hypothetical protein EP344_13330 [Bacteroidota bacterium]
MPAIRPLYEELGVEGYYRDHAADYANPHFPEIRALLIRNLPRIDTSGGVLDFAAGGGEVTQVLLEAGISKIEGCDPYTAALYRQNTGLDCRPVSFDQVIREGLSGTYSSIICSFALHLCPVKALYPLCHNLFQAAPLLVILTPHKRPQLEKISGIRLYWTDFVLTERGKKVHCKAYRSAFSDPATVIKTSRQST